MTVPLNVAEEEGHRETERVPEGVAQLVTVAGFVVATGVAVLQVLGLGVLEPERLAVVQEDAVAVLQGVEEEVGQREGEGVTVGVAQLDTEAGFDVASADAVTQLLGEVVLEPERLTEAQGETESVLLEVAEAEGQRDAEVVTVGVAQLETEAGFEVAIGVAVMQGLVVVVTEPVRLTEAQADTEGVAEVVEVFVLVLVEEAVAVLDFVEVEVLVGVAVQVVANKYIAPLVPAAFVAAQPGLPEVGAKPVLIAVAYVGLA